MPNAAEYLLHTSSPSTLRTTKSIITVPHHYENMKHSRAFIINRYGSISGQFIWYRSPFSFLRPLASR